MKFLLSFLPFRLNLFVQERIFRKGVFMDGMTGEQKNIALDRFFKRHGIDGPIKCPVYGPPFEPPWIAFPDYPQHSMGFRMGGGQDYMIQFRNWYDKTADNGETSRFKNKFPEPDNYKGFYAKIDAIRMEKKSNN